MKNFFYTLGLVLGLTLVAPVLVAAQTGADTPLQRNAETRMQDAARATSTAPRTTEPVRLEARLERAKDKAAQEIERRTEALNRLGARINAMKRVSTNFKSDLDTSIRNEITQLEGLARRIEASTDGEEIRADVQSIARSYRIFALVMPKSAIAAAADRIVTMSATLSEVGAKLKVRIDQAATAGADVSAQTAALNELAARITSANARAQAAVNGTAQLVPDEGDKAQMEANRAALQKAREDLRAAHEDIKAGRDAVRAIMNGLKTTNATSTDSAGTSAEPHVQA